MFDQIGNGTDLQAVFGGKQLQVRQARHGAIVVHDLADHGSRGAARHVSEVTAGLGVAGAHQYAAIHCLQRENVAGLDQVVRTGIRRHRRQHGAGPVGGRNAGTHPFCGLDRDGESRAFFVAIAQSHGWQLQPFAALACEGQADQATTEPCHEIDGLGRHMLGGDHQIAFVFTVFFVDKNHHAPGAHVGHDVFNRGNGHRWQGSHTASFTKKGRVAGLSWPQAGPPAH